MLIGGLTTIVCSGLAYKAIQYIKDYNDIKDQAGPVFAGLVGAVGVGIGVRVFLKGFYHNDNNPNNPNYQSPSPNTQRKRKYIERRIDEYGRESRIEREETIE